MKQLSDSTLLEAYTKAVELKLSLEFIKLLSAEIERRNLHNIIIQKEKD